MRALRGFLVALAAGACSSSLACERSSPTSAPELSMAPAADAAVTTEPDPGPVRTVDVEVPGDLPAVVVRGAREHRHPMLFVPGMCVHPGGYVMSFQHAAAARGDLVAVQGDVSCGDGAARRWSNDLDAMDRRIDAAFAAAGLGPPHDVVVIGYSQGAERAEKLVARWPEKYARAVLIASPIAPTPARLRGARAVVTMAGTFDIARERMQRAASALDRAGIPAAFFTLPNAHHGQMGDTPEDSMREALDFVTRERSVRAKDRVERAP